MNELIVELFGSVSFLLVMYLAHRMFRTGRAKPEFERSSLEDAMKIKAMHVDAND